MNKEKQATAKKMFRDIHELMEGNLDQWQKIDAIRLVYDDFVKNIKDLDDLEAHLGMNIEPLKKSRDSHKNKLTSALFPLNNILYVYLEDQQDGKASGKLVPSKKKLNKLGSSKLLKQARQIQKHIGKLQDQPGHPEKYGLTPAMIETYEKALGEYEKTLKEYNEGMAEQKKAVKKSEKLLKSNIQLLNKRMDRLMTAFSVQSPAFYKKYRSVRQGQGAQ